MSEHSTHGPFDDIRVVSDELDISGFDCGNPDLNDFIRNEALQDWKNDYSVTYVGLIAGCPAAFITLVAGTYRAQDLFKNGKTDYKYRQVPAVKIARIATDIKFQTRGFGVYFIDYAIAVALKVKKLIGCKLIIADALPDKIGWYRRCGFALSVSAKRIMSGVESIPMHAVLPRG